MITAPPWLTPHCRRRHRHTAAAIAAWPSTCCPSAALLTTLCSPFNPAAVAARTCAAGGRGAASRRHGPAADAVGHAGAAAVCEAVVRGRGLRPQGVLQPGQRADAAQPGAQPGAAAGGRGGAGARAPRVCAPPVHHDTLDSAHQPAHPGEGAACGRLCEDFGHGGCLVDGPIRLLAERSPGCYSAAAMLAPLFVALAPLTSRLHSHAGGARYS